MLEILITDLLDLAKIENNKFVLNNKYFDLIDTIDTTLKIMIYEANKKQIGYTVSINDKENLKYVQNMNGDQNRIQQVLINLISNSLKFTPKNGEIQIQINAYLLPQNENQREKNIQLEISVIDNGSGISEEGIKKLFIKFNKLDENKDQNAGGTGLGLSICQQMIEEMGGSILCRSTLSVGTEF